MDPHVAVLVLDTPIEGIASQHGDFGDNAIALLKRSELCLKKYQIAFDVPGDASDLERTEKTLSDIAAGIASGVIRGVFLTGSRSDSFATDVPWINLLDHFIKNVLFQRPDFPVVGICFGHQILAKNLGCKVGRNTAENGWEAGTHTVALNKSILDIDNSPFRSALVTEDGKVLEHINLLQFHKDIVYCNPPAESKQPLLAATSFQNVGSTPKCSIQGIVTESGPIKLLTFQGHPEFVNAQALVMLERLKTEGSMDTLTFERLKYKTNNLENQGNLIGQVISDFLSLNYN